MLTWLSLSLFLLLPALAQAIDPLPLDHYSVLTLDVPFRVGDDPTERGTVFLEDLNDQGGIVGNVNNGLTQAPFRVQNFQDLSTLVCGGADTVTQVNAINRHGEMAGTCFGSPTTGFLYRPGRSQPVTVIAFPEASTTHVLGLNDQRAVVGLFFDAQGGGPHGFWSRQGQYRQVDVPVPGAVATTLTSINNEGEIVGFYDLSGPGPTIHGFMLTRIGGKFIPFDVPESWLTLPFDINDRGEVVGLHQTSDDFRTESWIFTEGAFRSITAPSPHNTFTDVSAINSRGQLLGRILVADPSQPFGIASLGFLLTPLRQVPEALQGPAPEASKATPSLARLATRAMPGGATAEAAAAGFTPQLRLVREGCPDEASGWPLPSKLAATGLFCP